MQGEAGGDGGRVRRNTRKRNLDDAPQDEVGGNNSSAKRRHTTASPAPHDDEITSNSSIFNSRRPKVKRNSTSKSPKSQLDTLQFSLRSSGSPATHKHGSLKPPISSGSAAQPSGVLGASGGPWGSKPTPRSGLFSGQSHQTPLPNGPPTSSSTSSDGSTIPAGSNGTLPSVISKDIAQESFQSLPSLRYGYKQANEAAAGKNSYNDKPYQEAEGRSHHTRQGATGTQRWQSEGQENVLPSPRLNGTRKPPHAISSSDDGSYVGEEAEQDSDDDAFPTTRQPSARLRARGSTGNFLKGSPYHALNDEHGAKRGPFKKTPSGKDYHEFLDENNNRRPAKFTLFPDGYRLTGIPSRQFPCPVRTCARYFKELEHLEQHFKATFPLLLLERYFSLIPAQEGHKPSEFNDNLDEDGTLEHIRRRKGVTLKKGSIVVSQNPRHHAVLTNCSSTLQAVRKHNPVDAAINEAPTKSYGLRLDGSSYSGDDEQDSVSTAPSELHRAMAESKVWEYVAPLLPKSWTASFADDLEKRAFIQAISLPLKNKVDMEWLSGTRNSHQRIYRALMSVIFHVVGVESHCKPCESKIQERQRNCKVLPPEAAGMRELQEICGSQCVNCYFFQASKPCEFPGSSTTIKQTPVPVPVPPFPRPIPIIERSNDSTSTDTLRPEVASRSHVPSYSSYKAQKTEKPISETPVPIPSFTTRGPTRQSQPQDASDVSSENPGTKPLCRSGRVSKVDDEFGNSRSINGSYNTDESHPAAVATWNNDLWTAALISGGLKATASTEAASDLSPGQISSSQLAGRMFSLFGDIGRLPAEEQATLWKQMQQMAGMLQTSNSEVPRASSTQSTSSSLPRGPPVAADEWEIAPGRLIVDDKPMAFSTSFLSREVISLNAAQQLSPTQRVLNKSIAALHQLIVGPEEGWKCTCSIIRGLLKMKVGDVEARIGQGGLISVEKKCIITNVSHKEARIQVYWVEEG